MTDHATKLLQMIQMCQMLNDIFGIVYEQLTSKASQTTQNEVAAL